jgi:two-component system, NtrC family, sensor kinase
VPVEQLGPVREGHERTLHHAGHQGPLLVSYVPVSIEGRHGALEVSESMEPLERQAHRTMLALGASTGAIAILYFAAASALGRWLVGRPVAQLEEMAGKVGEGDFSARVALHQRDELGVLARAMNHMAEHLEQSHSALAAETERRLATLEQLRHADKLTTVGKLAAGLAHELGTPLNVVQGQAKMVATGEVEGEEAREGASVIVQQVQHMTRILRDLLDFARRGTPRRAPVPAEALLEQSSSLLHALASRRGVRLEAVPAQGLEVDVDAGHLQQVLTNLVVNAVQATPSGGTVRLSAQRVRAIPPADVGGGEREWVRLDVEDTGSGIPPEVLPRIFEPFFTTKDVGEGTGLGLSVSYGLVRDHGGWLGVESELGRGSRFSVYLPGGESA